MQLNMIDALLAVNVCENRIAAPLCMVYCASLMRSPAALHRLFAESLDHIHLQADDLILVDVQTLIPSASLQDEISRIQT